MGKEIEKKYLIQENGTIFSSNNEMQSLTTGAGLAYFVEHLASRLDEGQRLGSPIRQGYIPIDQGILVSQRLGLDFNSGIAEVRLRAKGNQYYLTVKSDGTISRDEFEKEISSNEFQEFWPLTDGKRIDKFRLALPYGGLIAEIDFFKDRDLITAEVECPDLETAMKINPLGKDITEDKKYKNKNLAK